MRPGMGMGMGSHFVARLNQLINHLNLPPILPARLRYRIWQLKIRQVQESDRGCYMCQINTEEMKKQIGCIDVLSECDTDLILSIPPNSCRQVVTFPRVESRGFTQIWPSLASPSCRSKPILRSRATNLGSQARNANQTRIGNGTLLLLPPPLSTDLHN